MSQEQFAAIMPFICSDLAAEVSRRQGISNEEAIEKLYDSKLYAMLECEDMKLWQYSTQMLYSLLEQEEKMGTFQFPDI